MVGNSIETFWYGDPDPQSLCWPCFVACWEWGSWLCRINEDSKSESLDGESILPIGLDAFKKESYH